MHDPWEAAKTATELVGIGVDRAGVRSGADMKPYDPNAMCPKCGHDKVGTHYQAPYHPSCDETCRDKKPERLERRCERCRFWWGESVIAPARAAGAGQEV